MVDEWRPYKHAGFFDRIRYTLLPAPLAKRHFFVPAINRVGVTLLEMFGMFLFTVAIVFIGQIQRGQEAESSGSVAQLLWIPMLATVMYRSIVTLLLGISIERSMMWHGYFSVAATAYGIWHGYVAIYLDKENGGGRGFTAAFQGEDSGEMWTGAFASGFMLLTVVTSPSFIRRSMRRVWLYSHHVFPLAAVGAAALHGAAVPAGAALFVVVDRLFGYVYQAHFRYARTKTECLARTEGDLVSLSFPKGDFSFFPAQYAGICIPSLAWFEWHSFTIASTPGDDRVGFLIKPDGIWTRRLHRTVSKMATSSGNGDGVVQLPMWMHGPLGSIALDWTNNTKYSSFILVAGGLGITPVISLYRHLAHEKRRGRPLGIVRLIFVTKNVETAQSVLRLEDQCKQSPDSYEGIDIEAVSNVALDGFEAKFFLTREEHLPDINDCHDSDRGVLHETVRWHVGRPDLNHEFNAMRDECVELGPKRVGCLTCGPDAVTGSVTKSARVAGGSRLCFDVHVEHFV